MKMFFVFALSVTLASCSTQRVVPSFDVVDYLKNGNPQLEQFVDSHSNPPLNDRVRAILMDYKTAKDNDNKLVEQSYKFDLTIYGSNIINIVEDNKDTTYYRIPNADATLADETQWERIVSVNELDAFGIEKGVSTLMRFNNDLSMVLVQKKIKSNNYKYYLFDLVQKKEIKNALLNSMGLDEAKWVANNKIITTKSESVQRGMFESVKEISIVDGKAFVSTLMSVPKGDSFLSYLSNAGHVYPIAYKEDRIHTTTYSLQNGLLKFDFPSAGHIMYIDEKIAIWSSIKDESVGDFFFPSGSYSLIEYKENKIVASKNLFPEKSLFTLGKIINSKNSVYLTLFEGGRDSLFRISKSSANLSKIDLPSSGSLNAWGGAQTDSLIIESEDWATPKSIMIYNGKEVSFSSLAAKMNEYQSELVYLKSPDGQTIAYEVLSNKKIPTKAVIFSFYGSYGMVFKPSFRPVVRYLMDNGVAVVVGHIRGGGEFGESFREDGRGIHKENNFLDVISIFDNIKNRTDLRGLPITVYAGSAAALAAVNLAHSRPNEAENLVILSGLMDINSLSHLPPVVYDVGKISNEDDRIRFGRLNPLGKLSSLYVKKNIILFFSKDDPLVIPNQFYASSYELLKSHNKNFLGFLYESGGHSLSGSDENRTQMEAILASAILN